MKIILITLCLLIGTTAYAQESHSSDSVSGYDDEFETILAPGAPGLKRILKCFDNCCVAFGGRVDGATCGWDPGLNAEEAAAHNTCTRRCVRISSSAPVEK